MSTYKKGITAEEWRWLKAQPAGQFHTREVARGTGLGDTQVGQALSRMAYLNRTESHDPWPGLGKVEGVNSLYTWDPGVTSTEAEVAPAEAALRAEGLVPLAEVEGLTEDLVHTAAGQLRNYPEVRVAVNGIKGPNTAVRSSRYGLWWANPEKVKATPLFGRDRIARAFGIPTEDVAKAMDSGELPTIQRQGPDGQGRKRVASLDDITLWVEDYVFDEEQEVASPTLPQEVPEGYTPVTDEPVLPDFDPFTGLTPEEEAASDTELAAMWEAGGLTVVSSILVGDQLTVVAQDGEALVVTTQAGRVYIAQPLKLPVAE